MAPQRGFEPLPSPCGSEINSLSAYQLAYRGMKLAGDGGIEPPCLVSETSVIAVIRIPNINVLQRAALNL